MAHYSTKPVYREDGKTLAQKGNKVFFLKGRIMAGQADLSSNRRGLTDFKWLTKHELEEQLPSSYYWRLRGMMAER